MASSTMRKRALSRSGAQPPIGAHGVELDRDARRPAAIAGGPSQGGHDAQVVEDHRPHVEDEGLRRLQRLLHHGHQLRDLDHGAIGVAGDEPLHDLGLEGDVGQALGRAVVHGARDVAPQVFLGVADGAAREAGIHVGAVVAIRAVGRIAAARPAPASASA